MQIRHFVNASGKDVFQHWMDSLKDMRARVAILRRMDRLADGNLGDCKFCRDGVWELKIDVGAGYRVYFGQANATLVLLLCGGDKRSQSQDIKRAVQYWQDWQK
jgi:putative addiction module killer protein